MNVSKAGGEKCTPNISGREGRKRLVAGFVQLAVSLLALAAMLATGLSRDWRLLLFLPLWGGAMGIFQALDKT
jgi:hypothetical protein